MPLTRGPSATAEPLVLNVMQENEQRKIQDEKAAARRKQQKKTASSDGKRLVFSYWLRRTLPIHPGRPSVHPHGVPVFIAR